MRATMKLPRSVPPLPPVPAWLWKRRQMRRPMPKRLAALVLAAAMAAAPVPGAAIAPVLLILVKQAAQQMAQSMIKDAILGSLRGMGCKGMALANALEAMDLRGGGGMGGAMALLGGVPKLPPGMGLPSMPGGAALPGLTGGAGLPGLPANVMAGMAGMGGVPGMPGLPLGGMPADVAARMGSLMPGLGQMPAGMAADPEQAAMMARMMEALSRPLSPAETVATLDELADLGFLPKAVQAELKECMVFVPASIAALGMGMGMLKPVVPTLRKARDEMHALSPGEQDEIAAALAEEMKSMSGDERAALLDHLDAGFFPARVARGVRAAFVAR